MRTWRVGTVSMGASLIFLGLFLFLSRFFGSNLVHVLTAWWPILLIVLGAEILLYLYFSRQEKPVLKYDLLSIFFVGVLGMFGIMLAILSTTGVIGKVEEVVAREERSFELPAFSYPVNEEVKRVVLRTTGYQMTIEATEAREVSMFGTYRAQTVKKEKLIKTADDFVSATQKGDTLYVNVKTLPNEVGPFYAQQEVAATILIPNNVKLEVIGNGNQVSLKPRALESNWSIDNVSSLDIEMNEANNVKIAAVGVGEVRGKDGTWQVTEKGDPNGMEGVERNAVYQSGEGKYQINIINTHYVSLNTTN
nr:hypothetical protein [Neobacillus sp. Marseille-Q6967]